MLIIRYVYVISTFDLGIISEICSYFSTDQYYVCIYMYVYIWLVIEL